MVRMLVGTMLRVGQGTLTVEAFVEILETRNRAGAGPAAVAKGLCLKSVTYGDEHASKGLDAGVADSNTGALKK